MCFLLIPLYTWLFLFIYFYLSVFEYPHFPESLHTASPVVLRCSFVFLNHQSLAAGIWGSVITLWFSGMCPGLPLPWYLNELWSEQHWVQQPLRWPSGRWPIQSALPSSVWDGTQLPRNTWVCPGKEPGQGRAKIAIGVVPSGTWLLSCVFLWLLLIFN